MCDAMLCRRVLQSGDISAARVLQIACMLMHQDPALAALALTLTPAVNHSDSPAENNEERESEKTAALFRMGVASSRFGAPPLHLSWLLRALRLVVVECPVGRPSKPCMPKQGQELMVTAQQVWLSVHAQQGGDVAASGNRQGGAQSSPDVSVIMSCVLAEAHASEQDRHALTHGSAGDQGAVATASDAIVSSAAVAAGGSDSRRRKGTFRRQGGSSDSSSSPREDLAGSNNDGFELDMHELDLLLHMARSGGQQSNACKTMSRSRPESSCSSLLDDKVQGAVGLLEAEQALEDDQSAVTEPAMAVSGSMERSVGTGPLDNDARLGLWSGHSVSGNDGSSMTSRQRMLVRFGRVQYNWQHHSAH